MSLITAANSESLSPLWDRSLILALPMIASRSSTIQTCSLPSIRTLVQRTIDKPCRVYRPQLNVSVIHYKHNATHTSSVVKTPSRSLPQFLNEKNAIYSSGCPRKSLTEYPVSWRDIHQCFPCAIGRRWSWVRDRWFGSGIP